MHTTPLIALLACTPVALAQPEEPAPLAEDAPWRTTVTLEGSHLLVFDTDVDSSDASVTTNVTRLSGAINFARPDNRLAFGVELRGEVADYDFDNANTLVAGLESDPFDTFLRQRVEINGRYAFDRNWGFFGLAAVEAAYESGADFGSAIQGGGTALATWTNDARDLTLGFGVGGFTRLDDDPVIFPLVTVRWQIDEFVRLENERLGLALTYEPCDEWAFGVVGRFDRAEYRLDEHNARVSEGVLTDNRVVAAGRITWTPAGFEGLAITLTGGAVVYRELELLDDDANEVFEDEADPSAFVGIAVRYEF
ncbi:MAG: hypothetical protein AAGH64_07400 [Planctomycetota bacterium]